MRNRICFLAATAFAGLLLSGCANTEQKLGRGLNNLTEFARMGEMRRTMEQTALNDGADTAYTTGFIRGLNRTFARTGIGLYEVVTCPFPPYDPVCTNYLAADTTYPDNYKPSLWEDQTFATDTNLGFSGGDVAPIFPGSRFRIFDTH